MKQFVSHLLQMRGLKQSIITNIDIKTTSHLLQMRGLKQCTILLIKLLRYVASFTDAWIETLRYLACGEYGSSHLLQMRGLKLNREGYRTRRQEVASFTDAWIETQVIY